MSSILYEYRGFSRSQFITEPQDFPDLQKCLHNRCVPASTRSGKVRILSLCFRVVTENYRRGWGKKKSDGQHLREGRRDSLSASSKTTAYTVVVLYVGQPLCCTVNYKHCRTSVQSIRLSRRVYPNTRNEEHGRQTCLSRITRLALCYFIQHEYRPISTDLVDRYR